MNDTIKPNLKPTSQAEVVKVQRASIEGIEQRIEEWLNSNVAAYGAARVKSIKVPSAGGLSGETLIVHLYENQTKTLGWHTLVVRKEVLEMVTNPLINFDNLLKAQVVLGSDSTTRVPEILGIETSADVLGAPFFVMAFAQGRIPADVPPYTSAGWVYDATKQQRQEMWQSGVDALVKVHAFDWQKHGLESLTLGSVGHNDNERYLSQAIDIFRKQSQNYESEVCEEVITWLQANCPEPEKRVLCWGDARIGNIIWNEFQVEAVIDWDMCFLGTPGHDLGWWSFFHRWSTDGFGLPAMSGTVLGQALADLYQERGGSHINNMSFYEILATFRGVSVWLSTFHSMKAQGTAPDMSPLDDSIHIIKVLKQLLSEAV